MNKLIQAGRLMFALGFIALGVLQFIHGDFVVGRPEGWPAGMEGKSIWVYLSGAVLVVAGICFLVQKFSSEAALVLGLMVLVYSFLFRHFAGMIGKGPEDILWSVNAFKTLALVGSTFIVGASIPSKNNGSSRLLKSKFIQWLSLVFLGYFYILCGFAHFKFFDFVNTMVPGFFPNHGFWTTLAGMALMATGIGILSPYSRKWAALAAGTMLLLWFFMVHIPRAYPSGDHFEWMGVCESFSFSGALLVLAGMTDRKETAIARI